MLHFNSHFFPELFYFYFLPSVTLFFFFNFLSIFYFYLFIYSFSFWLHNKMIVEKHEKRIVVDCKSRFCKKTKKNCFLLLLFFLPFPFLLHLFSTSSAFFLLLLCFILFSSIVKRKKKQGKKEDLANKNAHQQIQHTLTFNAVISCSFFNFYSTFTLYHSLDVIRSTIFVKSVLTFITAYCQLTV